MTYLDGVWVMAVDVDDVVLGSLEALVVEGGDGVEVEEEDRELVMVAAERV